MLISVGETIINTDHVLYAKASLGADGGIEKVRIYFVNSETLDVVNGAIESFAAFARTVQAATPRYQFKATASAFESTKHENPVLPKHASQILKAMEKDANSFAAIMDATGLSYSDVYAGLTVLQERGVIKINCRLAY